MPNLVESRFLQIPTIFNLSLRGTKCRGNPPEKVWSIYSVDLHPPGRLLRYCYSALNACALKLSFSAFLSKMQVPYEYRRSQTLASKFAHSALTQRQIKKCVILSVAKYPTTKVRSICLVSSSVGFFTIVQNDVKNVIARREVPIGDKNALL